STGTRREHVPGQRRPCRPLMPGRNTLPLKRKQRKQRSSGKLLRNGATINRYNRDITFSDPRFSFFPCYKLKKLQKNSRAPVPDWTVCRILSAVKRWRTALSCSGKSRAIRSTSRSIMRSLSMRRSMRSTCSNARNPTKSIRINIRSSQRNKSLIFSALLENRWDPLFSCAFPKNYLRAGAVSAAGPEAICAAGPGSAAPLSDANLVHVPLADALRSRLLSRIRDEHGLLTESTGGCALRANRVWVQQVLSGRK